jgi:NAD(P)-dependent dehydrogenase (short-subunit alcohol dehydrogenase family)
VAELDGVKALVTGASRGIGAACATALGAAGARVAVAARDEERLGALVDQWGSTAVALPTDLQQAGAAATLVSRADEALGGLDVVVNNAGVTLLKPSSDLSEDDIEGLYAVNQRAALLLAGRAAALMATRGGGCIVNMSSAASRTGVPWQAAYAATKGAVDAMTRSLAAEWGPRGVRVNAVNPGIIATDMWEAGLAVPAIEEHVVGLIPLGRVGTAEDVADVVVFLASDAARYVTAQTIGVDGGAIDTIVLLPRSVTGG